VTSDSLLINFFGVFHNQTPWAPYAGVGLGASHIKASGLQVAGGPLSNSSSVVFAYQLGTGIDFALTNYLSLDLGYRFFNSTKPKFTEADGQSLKMEYFNHSVIFGMRFGF
jgi:opacity protein-like surface antigen